MGHSARSELANLNYVLFFYFGFCASLSKSVSFLFYRILSVVFWCSKKQMIWVYAGWNVALVEHPKIVCDRSIRQLPRKSVSFQHGRFRFTLDPDNPISSRVFYSNPNPARFCLFYTLEKSKNRIPEAFSGAIFYIIYVDWIAAIDTVGSHLKLFLLGVRGQRLQPLLSPFLSKSRTLCNDYAA